MRRCPGMEVREEEPWVLLMDTNLCSEGTNTRHKTWHTRSEGHSPWVLKRHRCARRE